MHLAQALHKTHISVDAVGMKTRNNPKIPDADTTAAPCLGRGTSASFLCAWEHGPTPLLTTSMSCQVPSLMACGDEIRVHSPPLLAASVKLRHPARRLASSPGQAPMLCNLAITTDPVCHFLRQNLSFLALFFHRSVDSLFDAHCIIVLLQVLACQWNGSSGGTQATDPLTYAWPVRNRGVSQASRDSPSTSSGPECAGKGTYRDTVRRHDQPVQQGHWAWPKYKVGSCRGSAPPRLLWLSSPSILLTTSASSSRSASGSSSYQVNVNRQKTRKWVEAKPQNYDGDDWGADEYEDDEPDDVPEFPPPPQSPPVKQAHSSSPSGAGGAPPPPPKDDGHPLSPVLELAAVSPSAAADAGPAPLRETAGHDAATPTIASAGAEETEAFGAEAATEDTKPTFVRPSDIYRRMEEEREKERQSMDSARSGTGSFGAIKDTRRSASPSKLYDMTGHQNTEPLSPQCGLQPATPQQVPPRHASTSPQLPSLARMSAFGADLFPPESSLSHFSDRENEAKRPTAPLQVVSEDRDTLPSAEAESPPKSDARYLSQDAPVLEPDLPTIKPLRTPSPRVSALPMRDGADSTVDVPTGPETVATASKPAEEAIFRPPAPNAQGASNTATSSPVKDNEALTDEIMKSLGTTEAEPRQSEPKPISAKDRLPSQKQRESTYTLQDYDSYWADTDNEEGEAPPMPQPPMPRHSEEGPASDDVVAESTKAPKAADTTTSAPTLSAAQVAAVTASAPEARATDEPSQSNAAASSSSPETVVSPQTPGLRRKFSWEAPDASLAPAQPQIVSPPSPAEPEASQRSQEAPGLEESSNEGEHDGRQVANVSGSPPITSRASVGAVSAVTMPTRGQSLAGKLDEPSPVSAPSEPYSPAVQDTQRNSLAETLEKQQLSSAEPKSLAQQKDVRDSKATEEDTSSTHGAKAAMSLLPSSDSRTALTEAPALSTDDHKTSLPGQAPATPEQNSALGFREIMGLTTPTERINKYNESREIFSTTDSGLDNWIVSLRSQHPDVSPDGSLNSAATQPGFVTAGTGANPETPTSQLQHQHLVASPPGGSGSPTSRSRYAGMPMPAQGSNSGIGHPNQIGTKSKEFMQTAGKVGKGLLSKGRSKLRGTGDKVFH